MNPGSMPFLRPAWPAPGAVRAVTTTRAGGVSEGPHAAFNLGQRTADAPANVTANRARLRQILDLPAAPCWLRQVHGIQVVTAAAQPMAAPTADAAVAAQAGAVCAVLTADCLPVLFCTDDGAVVAAAHAGWRGLAGGVLEATVTAMASPAARIMAWLGPAIGPRVYEVGPEVRTAFLDQDDRARHAFDPGPGGRWYADLYRLARQRLYAAGVRAVYGGGLCTYTDAGRFYSYRRDGETGRMASLIWRV